MSFLRRVFLLSVAEHMLQSSRTELRRCIWDLRSDALDEPDVPEFTRRQLDILHSVTRGLTNADIARQFGISTDGVKHHIMAIFKKLGATNRSEAVAIALRSSGCAVFDLFSG